jgi:hypothetical protein
VAIWVGDDRVLDALAAPVPVGAVPGPEVMLALVTVGRPPVTPVSVAVPVPVPVALSVAVAEPPPLLVPSDSDGRAEVELGPKLSLLLTAAEEEAEVALPTSLLAVSLLAVSLALDSLAVSEAEASELAAAVDDALVPDPDADVIGRGTAVAEAAVDPGTVTCPVEVSTIPSGAVVGTTLPPSTSQ